MTTYELTRTDTETDLPAWQIRDEADRLDGAATDAQFLPDVPDHPERMRKPRREHHVVAARDFARLIGQTRITPDRPAIRDVYAHMDVATDHLHNEAVDWKDVPYWVRERQEERAAALRISDTYRAKAEATERHYREQCRQIWGMAYHGVLSTTPEPALPVSAEGERFLAQGPAPAEGFDTTAALGKLTGRVKTAVTASVVGASERTSKSDPPRVGWRRHADVIAGVAIGAGLFAALGVAYVTGVLT